METTKGKTFSIERLNVGITRSSSTIGWEVIRMLGLNMGGKDSAETHFLEEMR